LRDVLICPKKRIIKLIYLSEKASKIKKINRNYYGGCPDAFCGGKAYMLLCDDLERDHGDLDTATSFKADCDKMGIETVSMKNEFATIYGDFKLTPYTASQTEGSLAPAA